MERLFSEIVIVGAGAVGLAVARELSLNNREVIVLEKEAQNGTETSSRNSGVIHSGIYYAQNTLKSRFCVEGNQLLYEYAKDQKISFQNTGKLVLAKSSDELLDLEELYENGKRNGVNGLELIESTKSLQSYTKEIKAAGGLFCPSSGIIDTHELITALETDLQSRNSIIANNSFVKKIHPGSSSGFEIEVKSQNRVFCVQCDVVINCAGLHATQVAKHVEGMPNSMIPSIRYGKGHYFSLTGKNPFKDLLIYPLPSKNSLGIHTSPDLSGRIRFGPDLTWIDGIDYSFDENLKETFYNAIKEFWPLIERDHLNPDYTGIRPKICDPLDTPADFKIQTSDVHGLCGLINLFGIDSPGLTSCLAIGKHVVNIL